MLSWMNKAKNFKQITIHRERLIVYPNFRGRAIRHCRYRWRRSRNKPSLAEVIGTRSLLVESAWRSTLLGYGDVPSEGVQGARRRTTHAVPFPLEQKHYPHMAVTTWHTQGTQRRLQIAAASPSFFSDSSLDYSFLVIASTRSWGLLYTLVAFCVSREGPSDSWSAVNAADVRWRVEDERKRATDVLERKHDSLTGLWRSESLLLSAILIGTGNTAVYCFTGHRLFTTATEANLHNWLYASPLPLVMIWLAAATIGFDCVLPYYYCYPLHV